MTHQVCSMAATRVRSTSARRPVGFTPRQAAVASTWYLPSVAGLAGHQVKRTEMVGIGTNVWPLGLEGRSSG